jgi:hypothetical protein
LYCQCYHESFHRCSHLFVGSFVIRPLINSHCITSAAASVAHRIDAAALRATGAGACLSELVPDSKHHSFILCFDYLCLFLCHWHCLRLLCVCHWFWCRFLYRCVFVSQYRWHHCRQRCARRIRRHRIGDRRKNLDRMARLSARARARFLQCGRCRRVVIVVRIVVVIPKICSRTKICCV